MNVKLNVRSVGANYTGRVACHDICAPNYRSLPKKTDKAPLYVVIIFTAGTQLRENENVAGKNNSDKQEGVTATRNTQPPPQMCAILCSRTAILPSPRRAAGEIRDGTTGPCGQAGGFPNGQEFGFSRRRFTKRNLPRASGLSGLLPRSVVRETVTSSLRK